MEDLITDGREKLAAAQLIPLLSRDLSIVVRYQLESAAGAENAALIVWLLNHAGELLDELDKARRELAAVAAWIDALPQWYRAREVVTAKGPAAYMDGHIGAVLALAQSLGWTVPEPAPEHQDRLAIVPDFPHFTPTPRDQENKS
ncbi:hypothetical protein [Nocardia cyriacigeorgica]|uniref:Uncharacterized protein n=1 Tax=Nocardia cyriacigeorgica TaxID=135487 RepID=A0A5R8NEV5_9NOCA|nr:hypothetical protein [Nocardia cyriacigeorgica]TLF74083.1 hypothetical protein FEK34_25530 [Nocardia cyriacigeorgica]